jgi:AcrR family transcriptional regulator
VPEADTQLVERTMRSDARRNRDRLLTAATELILETGGEPSRDAVAQRAAVGIATLYRHFPEQQDLLRAVAIHVLERTIAAAEAALTTTDGDGIALSRYLHGAIDAGLGVVNIIHPLLADTDWPDQTSAAADVIERLVRDARHAGAIGRDITATEIVYAAIRFARPMAIGIGRDADREIAHRQLDHYLAGLRVATGREPRMDARLRLDISAPCGAATGR